MTIYTLICSDMGIECDHISRGISKEEAIKEENAHFVKEHPAEIKELLKKYSKDKFKRIELKKINIMEM